MLKLGEKTVAEAIQYRRSVRIFKKERIDAEKVKKCIKHAVLAPTSSNLQLWEFYHITNNDMLQKMSKACLHQNAANTANQFVVVAVRKDLWRKRAKANMEHLKYSYGNTSSKEYTTREKSALQYYQKVIPALYVDVFGILGWLKFIFFSIVGIFKPVYREVKHSDLRIVAHKSAALAAQNFMISMSAIGYDTCPMEGSDTALVKRLLNLPLRAEINMVIACGIRDENGVYGPRFRVPFEEVYRKI
jgi:nitroreductase